MDNVFEGTGVKRYVLRYRDAFYKPWQDGFQFDTLEEALAELEELGGNEQLAERLPCVRYKPVKGAFKDEPGLSQLLRNVLSAVGWKPYRLQYTTGHGWKDCPELQFDSVLEAQAAANSTATGFYRVMAAELEYRYEPIKAV